MAGVDGMGHRRPISEQYAERVRSRIKAGGIVNILQKHILGQLSLKMTQIRAAEILLRKIVPDVAAIQHTGANGSPLELRLVAYHPAQLPTETLPATDTLSIGFRQEESGSGLAS